MARVPGIEIDEVIAKYQLHPALVDIYVEGEFDRDFIVELANARGISSVISVFTISDVEVPNQQLMDRGLPLGSNKYRLILLAKIMEERLSHAISTNVSCVVDLDQDQLLEKILSIRHLIYTDYCAMEAYCLNESTLRKFLVLASNLPEESVKHFLGVANKILPIQFILRAVGASLSISFSLPSLRMDIGGKEK